LQKIFIILERNNRPCVDRRSVKERRKGLLYLITKVCKARQGHGSR